MGSVTGWVKQPLLNLTRPHLLLLLTVGASGDGFLSLVLATRLRVRGETALEAAACGAAGGGGGGGASSSPSSSSFSLSPLANDTRLVILAPPADVDGLLSPSSLVLSWNCTPRLTPSPPMDFPLMAEGGGSNNEAQERGERRSEATERGQEGVQVRGKSEGGRQGWTPTC